MLDSRAVGRARRSSSARSGASERQSRASTGQARYTGPYASAGPYEDDEGERYEVRLERVPGGLRLAEWSGGALRRRAPRLSRADVPALVEAARARAVAPTSDLDALRAALADPVSGPPFAGPRWGASPGRSGDMEEELRVEPVEGGMVRVARWVLRPGTGWVMYDSPTMYPAGRYAEALRHAARGGALAPEE